VAILTIVVYGRESAAHFCSLLIATKETRVWLFAIIICSAQAYGGGFIANQTAGKTNGGIAVRTQAGYNTAAN
jgi:hypothetical protein